MTISRRAFVSSGAALALAGPVLGADPVSRVGGPRLKLGLAAYSFREFLTGQKPPAMDIEDFIRRSAEMQVDGVELTSYYYAFILEPYVQSGMHMISVSGTF